jgi:GAF domain-containing protein
MMQAAILQAIAGLTRLAAALEPEKLLPQVVDLVRESLDLSHVRVYLLAGDALAAPGVAAGEKYDGTLFLAAAAGAAGPQLPAWGQRLSLSQVPSSVGRAVQSRAEVVCEDGPDALLPDARAEMALPLLVAGELLGVLDLLAVEPNRFSPEDMPLWTTLAEQAAVAVQQAHLLAELTRLYEISTALHTAVNLAEIAQALALPAGEAGVSSTTLFKFELDSAGQPEWMEAVATWVGAGTPATPVGARLYLPDFSLARLWSASPAMPLFISDVANDPRLDAAATSAFWPTGTGAAAILPLALKERWVGLAVINWAAPRLVTAGDRRLYHSLAGQAAVMVDNRLLFEQTQKRAGQLEKLAEIEAALSGAGHEAEILSALAPIVTSGRDKARLSHN